MANKTLTAVGDTHSDLSSSSSSFSTTVPFNPNKDDGSHYNDYYRKAIMSSSSTSSSSSTATTTTTTSMSSSSSSQATITVVSDPAKPRHVFAPLLIWWYFGPESLLILLALITSAAFGCSQILFFMLLGDLVDGGQSRAPVLYSRDAVVINQALVIRSLADTSQLMVDLSLQMTYIAIGALVCTMVSTFLTQVAHGRVGTRLKMHYFDSVLSQEIGFFDRRRTGQLLSEITESMEVIQDTYTNKLSDLVKYFAKMVFGILMALIASWKVALVMISIIPLILFLLLLTAGGMTLTQRFINKLGGQASHISNEVISSIRTVKSMDGEVGEKKRFYRKLVEMHKYYVLGGAVSGITIPLCVFLIFGDVALGFWYSSVLLSRHETTLANSLKVYGYIVLSIFALADALTVVPELGKASQHATEILKVIRRKPMMRPSGGLRPKKIEGHIEFKNVVFSYPTRPNVHVLRNFSLEICPGQIAALVGPSGSGKSTVISLIEKFYEPSSGQILLDGNDLHAIDPRWVHQNVGIVTQEPTLFATSIRDNILYAVKNSDRRVTERDIIDAAVAANAHDFIMALPDGYNTMLGERGISLSGGQKQRIAIARAMIQNPRLLLLDEATSALDTQSESVVQEALNKLMKGRTTIIIAHRLSTVIDSDVIVVMHKGEIREMGTHSELIQQDGLYRKLASRQMVSQQQAPAAALELPQSFSDCCYLNTDFPPEGET